MLLKDIILSVRNNVSDQYANPIWSDEFILSHIRNCLLSVAGESTFFRKHKAFVVPVNQVYFDLGKEVLYLHDVYFNGAKLTKVTRSQLHETTPLWREATSDSFSSVIVDEGNQSVFGLFPRYENKSSLFTKDTGFGLVTGIEFKDYLLPYVVKETYDTINLSKLDKEKFVVVEYTEQPPNKLEDSLEAYLVPLLEYYCSFRLLSSQTTEFSVQSSANYNGLYTQERAKILGESMSSNTDLNAPAIYSDYYG